MLNKIKDFINDMEDNNFYKKYIKFYNILNIEIIMKTIGLIMSL